MKRALALILLTLGACASHTGLGRIRTYPAYLPQNTEALDAGDTRFVIRRHPTDPSILIQPTVGRTAGVGLVQAATFHLASAAPAEQLYREAADTYAKRRGCTVREFYILTDISYEAYLSCPVAPSK